MINFVTSFSPDGYKTYAKDMLLSVIENWKDDLKLTAYYHDFTEDLIADLPKSSQIEYRNLNDVQDMLDYRDRMKLYDGTMGGKTPYNWRMDAIKWCHKVYAMTDCAFKLGDDMADAGWLVWLDADTITTKPLSEEKLLKIFPDKAELVYLGRKDVDYSETSFVAFNISSESPYCLLGDLRGCYDIGEVISYREWHDGFIFDRLLKIYIAHGLRAHNLTPNVDGLAAFAQSELSQYMTHFKGNLKNVPKDALKNTPKDRVPIVVRPKDCMPKDYIINNVNQNLKLIKNWGIAKSCRPNSEHAIIVSAGPSTDFQELRRVIKQTNGVVLSVKHSYPKLLKENIHQWGCIILDPRPIDGISTHGILRKDLFETVDLTTNFFVASMTDPSVTKHLMERSKNIHGWHAYSDAVREATQNPKMFEISSEANIPKDTTFVTGGTCAAMRGFGLMHILGFRNFHLFGFDCNVIGLTDDQKKERLDDKPKYIPVETNGEKFWTTGELLAMAQDCERLFNNKTIDANIKLYGTGTLVSEVYKNSFHANLPYFLDYFESK